MVNGEAQTSAATVWQRFLRARFPLGMVATPKGGRGEPYRFVTFWVDGMIDEFPRLVGQDYPRDLQAVLELRSFSEVGDDTDGAEPAPVAASIAEAMKMGSSETRGYVAMVNSSLGTYELRARVPALLRTDDARAAAAQVEALAEQRMAVAHGVDPGELFPEPAAEGLEIDEPTGALLPPPVAAARAEQET